MPMTVFAFCAMFGTGIGPVIMSWVEANPKLQWRWIQWIQLSASTPDNNPGHEVRGLLIARQF
jgi:hypothetical protein